MFLIGYHGTFCDNLTSIKENGFTCDIRRNHWLGQGVYFYLDDFTQTLIYIRSKRKSSKTICVIKTKIFLPEDRNKFLDLNKRKEFHRLINYIKDFVYNPDNNLDFDKNDPETARCFFIDCFSKVNKTELIICGFTHKPTSLIDFEKDIGFSVGIAPTEQQICVKNMKLIEIIDNTKINDRPNFRKRKIGGG